jgi:hypothetical protein
MRRQAFNLLNGSRVVSLPASPEAIRGYSKPALIIEDEASECPDELHLALRPMLATWKNGRFLLLSTPAGRAGHFHAACQSPSWKLYKVTAYDCRLAMHHKVLHIAQGFAERETLATELAACTARLLPSGRASFDAAGSEHDDAVLSLAMAIFVAKHKPEPARFLRLDFMAR